MQKMLETVEVKNFCDIDRETYNSLKFYRIRKYQSPLDREVVEKIENKIYGSTSSTTTNKIFVASNISEIQLLNTLVHELCHLHTNTKDIPYIGKKNIFHHEFTSNVNEWYLSNPHYPLTRKRKREIADNINELYNTKFKASKITPEMMVII